MIRTNDCTETTWSVSKRNRLQSEHNTLERYETYKSEVLNAAHIPSIETIPAIILEEVRQAIRTMNNKKEYISWKRNKSSNVTSLCYLTANMSYCAKNGHKTKLLPNFVA